MSTAADQPCPSCSPCLVHEHGRRPALPQLQPLPGPRARPPTSPAPAAAPAWSTSTAADQPCPSCSPCLVHEHGRRPALPQLQPLPGPRARPPTSPAPAAAPAWSTSTAADQPCPSCSPCLVHEHGR
ncbi:hypothetical protein P7K49_026012 [Saguinus oedipus]|uniref:Uncharacterized protein n=1 Tax=Saguinus oedipus TaxID=9490 RepID=A0ABQ9UIT5_SAGOE|nr:hypothetical protein P7K49_026012 [Saguinus oedipus]